MSKQLTDSNKGISDCELWNAEKKLAWEKVKVKLTRMVLKVRIWR